MKKLIILLLLSVSTLLKAEDLVQHKVDSLLNVLKNARHDSVRAHANYKLAMAYWGNDFNKTLEYANKALALYEKIGNLKRQGSSLDAISGVYYSLGKYEKALEFNKKSTKIRILMKDQQLIGMSYNNLGEIYRVMGNYPEALQSYFASLKQYEKCGYKDGLGYAYSNIGAIYEYQENYKDALKNYKTSLKYREEISDRYGIASCLANIAGVNSAQGNYDQAIKGISEAAKIFEEIGNTSGLAHSYNKLGYFYRSINNMPDALKYYKMSQELHEKLEDPVGLCNTLNGTGEIYMKEKRLRDARPIFEKALQLAKETGGLAELKESHKNLAELFSQTGDINSSYAHYKQYIVYRDSLFNNENVKKLTQTQMQYDFEKKEAQALSLQQKKDAVAKEEFTRLKLMRNGFIGGFTVVMIFAFVFFNQKRKIKKEKKKSDELLLNILPAEVAEELKEKGSAEAQLINEVTILFTDFKGFTQLSEKLTPKELVGEINECFSAFDHIMEKYGVEKIKTIGDAYMAAGGLPTSNTTHANDVVNAALDIQKFMDEHKAQKKTEGKLFFEIRIGVHSGPVVAGIVGVKKFAYDIWGDTVNTASRMESSGEAGKVNISGTTYELVKDKFSCTHRGKISAKGKGEIDMYFVERRI